MESILFSRNGKLPRPIFKKRGDPTGIDEVWQNEDVNVPIYNLNGQRIDKPRKGRQHLLPALSLSSEFSLLTPDS